ncbi:MAG: phosphotransferase family protein [Novosphingobium sp.]|nr:phosphotransferase family protein [Novosphingobium sp.]MCP5389709.1 phosphotransferase family protein [Novosphingobium sp.]
MVDPRNAPDQHFIDALRRRFPCEAEIDRVLTAKLKQRGRPDYRRESLDEVVAGIERLLRHHLDDEFTITNPGWLGGGASKIQVAFHLDWQDRETARSRDLVLRMEPPASIVETSRTREFEALTTVAGIVPVPECFWVDAEGAFLPHPGLVYARATGVTRPSKRPLGQVSGIGTNFGPELRPVLGRQFVRHLAAIHTVAPERLAQMTAFDGVPVGSNASIIRQVNWWRRVWEEDRLEAQPLVEIAARWLRENAPALDHVSLVHGDYRAGNFLYDEESEQITAWLDWELAVLGDRHQDLAWLTGAHFGHYAEDGTTFLASGLLPVSELLERYEQASGLTVDPARLRFFRVYNDFASTVHMLGTACRVARQGSTHQDVLVAWLAMIGPGIAAGLRATLEELL